MLCTIDNIFDTLTPCHLDQILQIGDQLYKTRCLELEATNALHESKILDQTQLPNELTIDECSNTIIYKHEDFRHGILDDDLSQSDLGTWLQYTFTVSDKNILILDGYMMAIYQHSITGQFLFFYSHSRNEIGLVTGEGTSVALLFNDFPNLLNYLFQLIPSVRARYFGIQPILIRLSMKESASNHISNTSKHTPMSQINNQSENTVNPEDVPSCSSCNAHSFDPSFKRSQDDQIDLKLKQTIRSKRLSRYDKWFLNQTGDKQNEIRTRKRQREIDRYASSEYAHSTRQKAREQYEDPEKAKVKRHQARKKYEDPEKAKVKRHQARKQYADPEKAKVKRHQAQKQYADPEKAKVKRHQARKQYADPEKAKVKRHQARKQYADLEKAKVTCNICGAVSGSGCKFGEECCMVK